MSMTTDEAMKLVVDTIEGTLLGIHATHDFQIEVTGLDDGADGTEGVIEFHEIKSDRCWVVSVMLTSDPT